MSIQGLEYWVRWQVPVCALVITIPMAVALNFIKKSKKDSLETFILWKPCWRNLSPIWLLCYRAFAFVCLASIFFNVVKVTRGFDFYFYTQWTFVLVISYFGLGTFISAYGCWMSSKEAQSKNETKIKFLKRNLQEMSSITSCDTYRDIEHKDKSKIQGIHLRIGSWCYLMQAIYQTCAGASVLTDIVFWCVLVPLLANVEFELTLLLGSLHAVNVVFLLMDTALNSLPFTWSGFAYLALWSCFYIIFQWFVHACGFMTRWPYPFLELNTPWAPLCYFGLALFHIPCYGIYALIVKAKHSILPRFFPRSFLSSYDGTDGKLEIDDFEEKSDFQRVELEIR